MTGFARAEAAGAWGRMSWELRSVNHRYLDLFMRMPEEFRAIENDLRTVAATRISRGKVEAQFRWSAEGAAAPPVDLDLDRLRALRAALSTVSHEFAGSAAQPDPLRALAWPGVVRQQTPDQGPLLAAARSLFEAALEDFTLTRAREGEKLAQILRDRCAGLEALVGRVAARLPEVRTAWLERLRTRCRELGAEVDPARLEQELVLAATRLDVDEELSRLRAHVGEVQAVLRREEAIGRRLDFLMQELNREANTVSSKSQDAEMTRCTVDMKVLIEQMREQVQNIE